MLKQFKMWLFCEHYLIDCGRKIDNISREKVCLDRMAQNIFLLSNRNGKVKWENVNILEKGGTSI